MNGTQRKRTAIRRETPGEVRGEVRRCITAGGPGGLIISSSNTIPRGVKPANYRTLLEALQTFVTIVSTP